MRTILALSLLVLAVSVGACGDSTEGLEPIQQPTGTAPGATTTATTAARAPDRGGARGRAQGAGKSCTDRGITAPPFREGACIMDGRAYVIANGRSALRMRTLTAALRGFSLIEQIRGTAPQQGAFLLIRLKVQNETNAPQQWHAGQTSLVVGGQRLEEQTAVEKLEGGALAGPGRSTIPPGETSEGAVVYDIDPRLVEAITREGVLYVLGFEPQTKRSQVGLFRIGVGG